MARLASKIALDSSIFIYNLEQHEPYWRECLDLLMAAEEGQTVGVASVLVYSEVLVKAMQTSEAAGRTARQYLQRLTYIDIVSTTKRIAYEAAVLRAIHGAKLKLPDAIHLATALDQRADEFVTNDYALANLHVDGLRIRLLTQPL
jgi:predicted nucleic acid-binding protein